MSTLNKCILTLVGEHSLCTILFSQSTNSVCVCLCYFRLSCFVDIRGDMQMYYQVVKLESLHVPVRWEMQNQNINYVGINMFSKCARDLDSPSFTIFPSPHIASKYVLAHTQLFIICYCAFSKGAFLGFVFQLIIMIHIFTAL